MKCEGEQYHDRKNFDKRKYSLYVCFFESSELIIYYINIINNIYIITYILSIYALYIMYIKWINSN